MHSGNYDKIFKYPAVHYIPLRIYDENIIKNIYTKKNLHLYIYTSSMIKDLRKQINFPYIILDNELGILIINAKINFIKYRGYEIFLVGFKTPGYSQLFKITQKYFYKDHLIFSFYEESTGQRLITRRYSPDKS